MRVLVTGASGMLGKDIVKLFSRSGGYEIYTCQIDQTEILNRENINSVTFDLTDSNLFSKHLKEIRPDLIIHCAAIVNVDACEKDKDKALKLHSETINQIAIDSPSSKLVYISTDSVFDGSKGDYLEKDKPNPLNYYATSKLEGEQNTLKLVKNSMVVRTNIYGFHLQPNKVSLAEWALDSLQNKRSIGGFIDVWFNPVYTMQLAEAILKLINIKFSGIINVAAGTVVSKYSFLTELARIFGYDPGLIEMKSVDSMNFTARRPCNTTLNLQLLVKTLGIVPSLFEGLTQFHDDYQSYKRFNEQAI